MNQLIKQSINKEEKKDSYSDNKQSQFSLSQIQIGDSIRKDSTVNPFLQANQRSFFKKSKEEIIEVKKERAELSDEEEEDNPMKQDLSESLSRSQSAHERNSSTEYFSFPEPNIVMKIDQPISKEALAKTPVPNLSRNQNESVYMSKSNQQREKKSYDQYRGLKNPEQSIATSKLERARDIKLRNCLKSVNDLINILTSKRLSSVLCRDLIEQSQKRIQFIKELEIAESHEYLTRQ